MCKKTCNSGHMLETEQEEEWIHVISPALHWSLSINQSNVINKAPFRQIKNQFKVLYKWMEKENNKDKGWKIKTRHEIKCDLKVYNI